MGSIISQILKLFFNAVINKQKFNVRKLTTDGGYPSSHTSFATSITAIFWYNTICKWVTGLSFETELWITSALTVFWLITVRDALGVRYTVQKLCECVTLIAENNEYAEAIERKLKIKSGHRPYQVIAGAILGLIIASFTSCIYYEWYKYIFLPVVIFVIYVLVSLVVVKRKHLDDSEL